MRTRVLDLRRIVASTRCKNSYLLAIECRSRFRVVFLIVLDQAATDARTSCARRSESEPKRRSVFDPPWQCRRSVTEAAANGEGVRGRGEGRDLLVDKWITRHRGAGCAATWTAVIGAGVRGQAVVGPWSGDAAGIQRVPGVGTESLRADSAFSRRVSRTTCARVAGPCRAAVSACSAPEPAGCRPALALQPPGAWGRADPGVRVCAGAPAVRRLGVDPPRRRGDNRRRAVVSDGAGDRLPQSRPYPRGGSTLSSAARSSPQIASSFCASADSWRASGRLSSHA